MVKYTWHNGDVPDNLRAFAGPAGTSLWCIIHKKWANTFDGEKKEIIS